jgi:hypothetical protein
MTELPGYRLPDFPPAASILAGYRQDHHGLFSRDRFGSIAELNEAFQAALAHALNPSLHAAPALIPVPPSNPTILRFACSGSLTEFT